MSLRCSTGSTLNQVGILHLQTHEGTDGTLLMSGWDLTPIYECKASPGFL
jgi:hypothetical protein